MAKYTEAQKKAMQRYLEDKSNINIVVTKSAKERYKKHAENLGISLTELFCNLIEADIKRHEQGKE